ncbi:response regulator [Stigmatella sp. ncwal1]|uniref:Response regulator n=1 Tax=Stigmatella ashevillensis TaxID=2995309 RepID=A0ABT5DPJ2_9BACT|nr:response regulator [Stigmatella ashevillena]MDC0715063.1 response regulator [Stigmatella ashevillena]
MDLPFEIEEEDEQGGGGTLASTVLLVDDELVVLDICTRLLSREPDLLITQATSAEEALPLLRAQRFDVLVTDKNLPQMSGIELIAEARRLQPSLEAMMITGYASSESVIAAFAAGASDYILKPFDDLRVLRAKVRAALERRTERIRGREQARHVARQASALIQAGKDAPEPAHQALEDELRNYEQAVQNGAMSGHVAVVGSDEAVELLRAEGFEVAGFPPAAAALESADVVILETGEPQWRVLADHLQSRSPDLLLLSSPQADLADLLEAISLRLDLVGFGASSTTQGLPDRLRMVLLRRCIQRAQDRLATALAAFHQSIPGR